MLKLSDLGRVCNQPESHFGQPFGEVDTVQLIENAKNVFQMRGSLGFALMQPMTPDKAKQFSRMIWAQNARAAVKPILLGVAFSVLVAVIAIDVPISKEQTTCSFVRWTQWQNYYYGVSNIVYCDLADGRTIMARASNQWIPALPGSQLKLQIRHLVFRTKYRIVD